MYRLSWNLGASTSRNPQGLSRPVGELLYLYLYLYLCDLKKERNEALYLSSKYESHVMSCHHMSSHVITCHHMSLQWHTLWIRHKILDSKTINSGTKKAQWISLSKFYSLSIQRRSIYCSSYFNVCFSQIAPNWCRSAVFKLCRTAPNLERYKFPTKTLKILLN